MEAVIERVTGNYNTFLMALTGRYLQAVAPGAVVTPHSINMVRTDAQAMRKQFLFDSRETLLDHVAHLAEGTTIRAQDMLNERLQAILRDLTRITLANLDTLDRDLKTGRKHLGASMSGALGILGQQKVAAPDYKAQDSAGRTWDSAKLVAFLMKDMAYQSHIDSVVGRTYQSGNDLVQVVYKDATHAGHGKVISIRGETAGYPMLSTVRPQIFHPNATAEVVPYVLA